MLVPAFPCCSLFSVGNSLALVMLMKIHHVSWAGPVSGNINASCGVMPWFPLLTGSWVVLRWLAPFWEGNVPWLLCQERAVEETAEGKLGARGESSLHFTGKLGSCGHLKGALVLLPPCRDRFQPGQSLWPLASQLDILSFLRVWNAPHTTVLQIGCNVFASLLGFLFSNFASPLLSPSPYPAVPYLSPPQCFGHCLLTLRCLVWYTFLKAQSCCSCEEYIGKGKGRRETNMGSL